MIDDTQRQAWARDGFFIIRGFADAEVGAQMEHEVVDMIRRDPPDRHPGVPAYATSGDLIIKPESTLDMQAGDADTVIAKVFNPHLSGAARDFALSTRVAAIIEDLLGDSAAVFQSQFIFKNPRAFGQPWHQDSYYFPFDKQPQIGVWLAISEATLENGCLSVLPGSHSAHQIFSHNPDSRTHVNQGYLEVREADDAAAVPVLMQPGDVLFFHSYLLHKSEDNRATSRRSAMVYHYGRLGTKPLQPLHPAQAQILRWVPLRPAA